MEYFFEYSITFYKLISSKLTKFTNGESNFCSIISFDNEPNEKQSLILQIKLNIFKLFFKFKLSLYVILYFNDL